MKYAGSPLKRKGSGEASSEKIRFLIKQKSSHKIKDKVFAENKYQTLAHVLKKKYKEKNIENMLVWAEICGHTGMKCVNPFLLQCGFIKPETVVELEETKKSIYYRKQASKRCLKSKSSLFFISISDRKGKTLITMVHYTDLRHYDICVVANRGETIKEALDNDCRFQHVDRFTLEEKEQGCGIGLNEEAADVKGKLLEVNVKKARKNDPITSTSKFETTSSVDTADKSPPTTPTPNRRSIYEKLSKKLWEENAVYVPSITEALTKEKIYVKRVTCLRARAWATLLGRKDRKEGQCQKSLAKLACVEFANHSVIARPIRITRTLVELSASIGFLKCGSVTATCFLVSKDVIVTNYHVVREILSARNSSTPYDHSEVFVNFDHEGNTEPRQPPERHKLRNFMDKNPDSLNQYSRPYSLNQDSKNLMSEPLDYAFLYLENSVEGKHELGNFVRCNVPEQGSVCIVGHPNGEEKKEELCAILPPHEDRRALELERRLAENYQRYENSPSAAALFMYYPNIRKLYGDKATMTYDVGSMFEGSSGAPVFDMKCNIVALHTRGFRLEQTSIVEVGVTFHAIIRDLRARGHSDFVRENFGYHLVEESVEDDGEDEEMDTD